MAPLTHAHRELFRRNLDECYSSLDALSLHCLKQRAQSEELWQRPQDLTVTHDLTIVDENGNEYGLNDWSFGQVCRLARVSKETINRLSWKTASTALEETLPRSDKPLQLLTTDSTIRAVHGVSYTRLWNTELLDVIREIADDFVPPPVAHDGMSTGLYAGEQDLFAFLIDPTGWVEIEGEAFAPGLFVWNSEVGRRSLGIQTFWFQKVCQNHIVWDAAEIVEFSRKHTASVRAGLGEIQQILSRLVAKRDQRRDAFASVIHKAKHEQLGRDEEEVLKMLSGRNIPRQIAAEAMQIAQASGSYTIFSLVDALTKVSQKITFIGDRSQLDLRSGQLLALAV